MQDVEQFEQGLRTDPAWCAFLNDESGSPTAVVTRAPGRLDVMGGVGDYSGALVAETTLAEAALVALTRRADRQIRVWSVGAESDGFDPQVSLSLDLFYNGPALRDEAAVRQELARNPRTRWCAYIVGCFYTLLAEGVVPDFPQGANLLLRSDVPLGAGVSSSAAIEVATMQAISAAYGLNLNGVTLARLAQRTENGVVGAPCGIMDQMTSALGVENSLFLLLCQPHTVQGTQALPPGVRLFGINSAVKHSVGGSAYARARVAAFMGRKLLGVDYLASLHPSLFFSDSVPTTITGAEFLAQHGETGDAVTRVDPATTYPVFAATRHAIFENERVKGFVSALSSISQLQELPSAATSEMASGFLDTAGNVMYQAHDGYNSIGLGSEETDLLVQLGRETGRGSGIYGAKISGGGSGGTVIFLTYGEAAEGAVQGIASTYAQRTGLTPQVFAGSSPGAMAFGHRTVNLQNEF